MRRAFTSTLVDLARADSRVLLLTGDLGYQVLEPFIEEFPDRFFNAGVAEQNMVGLATGLAADGFVPFVYSIATFAVLRPFEFIRNGPAAHRLPVRIVGVGCGVDYGMNGVSHYGLEDVGVMRLLPSMTIVAPADHQQARRAIRATWDLPGPVYYRLGRDETTTIPGLDGRFDLGRMQIVRQGQDVALIALGAIAAEAAAAAEALDAMGVSCAVAVVSSVSPAPAADLAALLSTVPLAVTVEAHAPVGGLGSLVSEVIASQGLRCRVCRCGIEAPADGRVGRPEYLHARLDLSKDALVTRVLREREPWRS